MVQRKKENIQEAILEAGFQLFTEKGYSETTVPAIARAAGISTANVYVYFESKMQILFTLYAPWLRQRLEKLDKSLRRIQDPKQRLKKMLIELWRELPKDNNGFAHNVVEAVSSSSGRFDYNPELRVHFVDCVAQWLKDCGALNDKDCYLVATLIVMAFDGFATNVSLKHGIACTPQMAELFSELLLHGCAARAAGAMPDPLAP